MKAKKIALSVVASALLLSFAGCGDDSSNNDSTPAAAVTPGVTGDGRETVYTALVADNADTTGVTLNAATSTPSSLAWASSVALPTYDASNEVNVTANITADTTWLANKQYRLVGQIKVSNNATLTIPAGTVVFGDAGANYMVVLKGSKLVAEGTAANPITFTSLTALQGGAAGQGQWGGLTLLGDAPTNHTAPVYEVDEDDTDFAFGGTTAADDSGSLKYVRILNSGYTVATDLEINGLSLCGVGSGTTVENIYVENSSDDGIEIWGGTVDLTDIEIVNAGDDSFDLDYGYVGNVSNLTVTQESTAHAGMEISSGGDTPLTSPTISNFRVTTFTGSDEGGIYLKDDTTAPTFINGLVHHTGDTTTHGAIRAKSVPTTDAANALAFKNVVLDPAE